MSIKGGPWVLFIFLIFTSCYQTQPTTLEVTVKDESGSLIQNAMVHVYGEPSSTANIDELEADYYVTTNSDGMALINVQNIFKPGQNGVAILHVSVTKNEKSGSGNIELVQENDNKIEIVIE